jgi:hypothetical protein
VKHTRITIRQIEVELRPVAELTVNLGREDSKSSRMQERKSTNRKTGSRKKPKLKEEMV